MRNWESPPPPPGPRPTPPPAPPPPRPEHHVITGTIAWKIENEILASRMTAIRAIVQEWLDKQGHDRCWYYPELFQQLAQELNLKPSVPPCLPTRDEFEEGCRRYQIEEYEG